MQILFLTKRFYGNRDLIEDRFGRLYNLPVQLASRDHTVMNWVLDFRTGERFKTTEHGVIIMNRPTRLRALPLLLASPLNEIAAWEPDVIVASGHIHLGWIGQKMAQAMQIPFFFDIYDYYPAFHSSIQPLIKPFFDRLCRRADGITIASAALQAYTEPLQQQSCLLENGYDPMVFRPMPEARDQLRKQFGISSAESAIAYTGSISDERGINLLLAACKQLRSNACPVRLLLAGALSHGFSAEDTRYTYLGNLSQDRIAQLLNAVDLGVVPYRPTTHVHYSNSCKLVEYLACQLPIVATRTGDHQRLLGKDHPGLVPPDDPNALAHAIQQQLQHRVTRPIPTQFSWDSLGRSMEDFLTKRSVAP